MKEVGVFRIGKPKCKCDEFKIFKSIMSILTKDEFNKIIYDDDETGLDILYIITDEYKLNMINSLFIENKILIEHKKMTKDFLYQNNLPPILESLENKVTLNNFLLENLNSDIVLDKINDLGIDSLTEIDLLKLKNPI